MYRIRFENGPDHHESTVPELRAVLDNPRAPFQIHNTYVQVHSIHKSLTIFTAESIKFQMSSHGTPRTITYIWWWWWWCCYCCLYSIRICKPTFAMESSVKLHCVTHMHIVWSLRVPLLFLSLSLTFYHNQRVCISLCIWVEYIHLLCDWVRIYVCILFPIFSLFRFTVQVAYFLWFWHYCNLCFDFRPEKKK